MRTHFAILFVLLALTAVAQERVTLLFGGDAMGHSPQFQWAYQPATNTYDYEPCFRYIKPYVEAADLAVVNVEVTYGGEPYSGYPNFSTPDAYHDALLNAGWDVMLLANNHILDRGRRGLERTLRVIGDVPNAGAYSTPEDREARYPLIVDVKGLKVAIFNCTYGCNGYMPIAPNMVNFIDTAQIASDLKSIEGSDVDLRVMCIHWGVEYELKARQSQRDMAKWLTRKGFDLIIGGHPHVVEDAEFLPSAASTVGVLNGVPVFYSLGNLISNQRRENTNGGILVRVELTTKPLSIEKVEYLPCYVHKGTITYPKTAADGAQQTITERQYFLIPTPAYLNGAYPFRLTGQDDADLRLFDKNTRKRLSNIPLFEE